MLKNLPENWSSTRLEDVCDRITVGHVGSMADKYKEIGIPFLRSQNVHPFKIDLNNVKYIDEEFNLKLKKCALKPGDVAVVRTGYPGTAAVIPESLLVANCADLVVITPSSKLNSWYLSCLFNSIWGKGRVAGNLVGVAQQHFNVGAAKALQIPLPPLPIQKRIAGILSAYDNLIAVNTRRIEALEEMTRRTYEEWFVHYRFLGGNGTRPDHWKNKRIDEIIDRFSTGKKYNKKTVNSIGQVPVLDQGKSGIIGYHDGTPGYQASNANPVIVFANHTCYQKIIFCPFSTIQNVIPFKPKRELDLSLYWLHYATNGTLELNDYKGHWPQFSSQKITVPSPQNAKDFESFVKPKLLTVQNLQLQNANLCAQRDLLLPRLISGEIEVSDAPLPTVEAAE